MKVSTKKKPVRTGFSHMNGVVDEFKAALPGAPVGYESRP
jgi:hypothetical protein